MNQVDSMLRLAVATIISPALPSLLLAVVVKMWPVQWVLLLAVAENLPLIQTFHIYHEVEGLILPLNDIFKFFQHVLATRAVDILPVWQNINPWRG
jgi:hypothetical protein